MGKNLLKTSLGVTIVIVIGSLLSFVKEATIANYFGVSGEVDAYAIAIQIPVLLFSFISVAVQSVVIPIYSDILYNKSHEAASKYVDNLITLLLIITGALVLLGEVFAGGCTYLFAPGFAPEIHDLSTELLRITFPTIIFSIVCQVFVAVLNVHKEFVINSFAIYFTNVTLTLVVVYLHTQWGIASACIGQLMGDALRCGFVIYLARKFYKYRFGFKFRDVEVVKTLKMSLPVLWSISVAEINAIVNRIVGSFLFAGSIAALSYAGKINSVLMQLFVSAIATVVYPLYAESTAKNDIGQLNRRVNSTISAYTLFVLPLMCGLFVYKKEVVELAFARGAFDHEAVTLTQSLLGIYAIGMLFMSFRSTLNNVFYSMKDTKTPAINATIGSVLNIVLNISLPYFIGVQGIALASSITGIFITVSMMMSMLKKYNDIKMNSFFINLRGIAVSSVLMLLTSTVFHYFFGLHNSMLVLGVGVVLGITVYTIGLLVMKVPIANQIIEMAISKRK